MLNLQSYLEFGKYSGTQLRELIHEDPDYVVWCIENEVFEVDEETLEYLENVDLHYDPEELTELYHNMHYKD